MKKAFSIILFLLPVLAFSHDQAPDRLIWNEDTFVLETFPLADYPEFDSIKLIMFGDQNKIMTTVCLKGYIAEWTIIRKTLYLTNIFDCVYSIRVDLKKVFGSKVKNGKLKADWVSTKLFCPLGEQLKFVSGKFSHFHEREIFILVEKGKVLSHHEYNNTKSYFSIFTNNPDSLQKYIYSQINWDIIPPLKDEGEEVSLTVFSGAEKRPDSIVITKAASDILNQEAIRVISELPDWDIYYRFGEVYPNDFKIDILFEEWKRILVTRVWNKKL